MKEKFEEYVDIICIAIGCLAFALTTIIHLMYYTDFSGDDVLVYRVTPALFAGATAGFVVFLPFRLIFGIVIYGLDPDDSWDNFWAKLSPFHGVLGSLSIGMMVVLLFYCGVFILAIAATLLWPVLLALAVITALLYFGKYLLDRGKEDWRNQ